MADEAITSRGSGLARDVDAALTALDAALLDARRAVEVMRGSIAQIDELEQRLWAMEAAMNRALESLAAPLSVQRSPAVSQLPPVAPEATQRPADTAPGGAETAGATSHCLRLTVQSKGNSLDLKAVDNAVNANLDIVDVALLDYDGRQATLKLWVNPDANIDTVRAGVMESLRKELGDETAADAYIELEEAA